MKNISTIFLLVFISTSLLSQSNSVRIESEKDQSTIKFYALNDLLETQKIEFKLMEIKGLKGYSKPIVKPIAPGERTLLTTVRYSGAHSYKISYSYSSSPSRSEGLVKTKKKNDKSLEDFGNIKTGIVVFEKNGCGRCNMSTSYLLDNNIDFKIINVSDRNSEGNKLMWELIRADGFKDGNIQTPVILVDGELSHSHKNLRKFLGKLSRK